MRKLDEKREVLYVIRAMDVLMSSGIGLEATVHSISQGGYGIISEDFSNMMDKVRKGGRPLANEIKSLMGKVETDGYRRLLIGPIILAVLGLFPQLVGDMGSFFSMPEQSTIDVVVNIGLLLTLFAMIMIGIKTHTKDPGL